jgi:hypothetical protein
MSKIEAEKAVIRAVTDPPYFRGMSVLYDKMSTRSIIAEIKRRFGATADNFRHIAYSIRVLDNRGQSAVLSSLIPASMLSPLRRIAYGHMHPKLLEFVIFKRASMQHIQHIPIEEQSRVATDEPIVVVQKTGNVMTSEMKRPSEMARREFRQVFGGGSIRDESAQREWLAGSSSESANGAKRTPALASPIVVDKDNQRLVITGKDVVLTLKDLRRYLKKLYSTKSKK